MVVYRFDDTGVYLSCRIEDEDYILQDNETKLAPIKQNGVFENRLENPVWNFDKQIWEDKVITAPSSQEQQILSTLAKQVMDLQLENVQQKQINASLTKQIMNLKGAETHE